MGSLLNAIGMRKSTWDGTHDKKLYGDHGTLKWKQAYTHYVSCAKIGCIILCGNAEGFAAWASSAACRGEVAKVPDGRLFALIENTIVSVNAQAGTAAWTVENGLLTHSHKPQKSGLLACYGERLEALPSVSSRYEAPTARRRACAGSGLSSRLSPSAASTARA